MNAVAHLDWTALCLWGVLLGVAAVLVIKRYGQGKRDSADNPDACWPPPPPATSATQAPCIEETPHFDPLNPAPSAIQPILFADGFRVTAEQIYAKGLTPLVTSDGRVDSVLLLNGNIKPVRRTVLEWLGDSHGARIS